MQGFLRTSTGSGILATTRPLPATISLAATTGSGSVFFTTMTGPNSAPFNNIRQPMAKKTSMIIPPSKCTVSSEG